MRRLVGAAAVLALVGVSTPAKADGGIFSVILNPYGMAWNFITAGINRNNYNELPLLAEVNLGRHKKLHSTMRRSLTSTHVPYACKQFETDTTYGSVCQQPDGSWEIVQERSK